MKSLLIIILLSSSICFGQYTEIYYHDFKAKTPLTEWSTDKPIAGAWNNPIKIDSTPNGNRKFLGQFGDQSITLNLTNLPPHDSVKIEFHLYIIKSWDGNYIQGDCAPDIFSVNVDNKDIYHTTFANNPGYTQDYPDQYDKNNLHNNPTQYMADEVNTLGYLHYGHEEWYDYGDAVYHFKDDKALVQSHTGSDLKIIFDASLYQSSSIAWSRELRDESWGITLVKVSLYNCYLPVSITSSGVTSFCAGDSVVLSAKPEGSNFSYEWSNGSKSRSIVVYDSGYYLVKVTDKYGCFDTTGIRVNVKPSMFVNIDTLHTKPGNVDCCIRFKLGLNHFANDTIKKIYFHISFDSRLFLPNVNPIIKQNYIDNNGDRHIVFEIDSLNLTKQDTFSFCIAGLSMFSEILESKIFISEFSSNGIYDCIDLNDGMIILDSVCAFGLRRVQLFNPPEICINPNPITENDLQIEIKSDVEGLHIIHIYNIQGVLLESKAWDNKRNANKTLNLNTSNYSDGIYYIELQTPWNIITKKLVVVK